MRQGLSSLDFFTGPPYFRSMENPLLVTGYAPAEAHGAFDLPEASWLVASPNTGLVYVLGELETGLWGVYRAVRGPANGLWERVATGETGGPFPCHAVLMGDLLLVAHYGNGSVTALGLDAGGLPERAITAIAPSVGAHAHALLPYDTAHLLVVDLGREVLELYRKNSHPQVPLLLEATLELGDSSRGIGPRHIALHPKLPLAYVVTEYSNELLVVELSLFPPSLKLKFRVSLLPGGWSEPSFAGTVKVTPDGNFLLATNRGHDSVVSFSLAQGLPTSAVWTPSGGHWPRDATLSANGDTLAVANQKSDNMAVFGRNLKTGALTPRDLYPVAGASCVVFQGDNETPTLDCFDNTL
jgi:6-phosphogluconolactonase